MDFTKTDILILVLIIGLVIFYIKNHYSEVTIIKTKSDREFLVQQLPDKERAANILDELATKLTSLVNQLTAKYPNDENIQRLYKNFNPKNISEGGVESGYTSYSVNKGEKLVLCIRNKDEKNSFVDTNVVMYVAIHELAHLATSSIGHNEDFWKNFRFLLTEAIEMNLYKKVDFAKNPTSYCGINITSSVV